MALAVSSSGYQTYTGPDSITPFYPSLLQVRSAGDFESYLSFGIGLTQRARFRVFTLTQPYRVVIDVAHRNSPPFPGVVTEARTGRHATVSGTRPVTVGLLRDAGRAPEESSA